jgi:coproporphyrinogen III oxidase
MQPSDPLASSGKANIEMRKKMEKMLREVQDHVCKSVEEVDGGAKFRRDEWSREDGGGGVSAVMGGGKVCSVNSWLQISRVLFCKV